jgi:hypothetical protein
MDIAERARAAHLIAAIAEPGDCFPLDAARELIDLVPLTSRRANVGVDVSVAGAGPGFEAAAAGGGLAQAGGDVWTRRVSVNAPPSWACGWYRIDHRPGRMTIVHAFEGTFEDDSGRACLLRYDGRSGRPERLDVRVQSALVLGPLRIALSRFRPWKWPG